MEKLKIGIIGEGRLGRLYMEMIHNDIKRAELIAVSSQVDEELDFAQRNLGIRQVYRDYRNLLALNELDAVFIATSPDQHIRQIQDALKANLHTFSESPVSLNVEGAKKIVALSDRMQSLTVMIGFVRRYDKSYRYAFEKITEGKIGKPIFIRSQTVLKDQDNKATKKYAQTSGGIFLDFNLHDIDIARWYLNDDFSEVYSTGSAFKYPSYADIDDADYAQTVGKMEQGSMVHFTASRLASHGLDIYTEVVGTEGSLRIGRLASIASVEILDQYGVRKDAFEDKYTRFAEAHILQAKDFIDCVLDGRKPLLKLNDALEATRVAIAMTRSYLMKKIVVIER